MFNRTGALRNGRVRSERVRDSQVDITDGVANRECKQWTERHSERGPSSINLAVGGFRDLTDSGSLTRKTLGAFSNPDFVLLSSHRSRCHHNCFNLL